MIAAVSPASVGMSKERWSRTRSLTLAALRDLGVDLMPARDPAGLSAQWRQKASHLPTKAKRLATSRFMSHCTRKRVEPGDVTQETFDGFEAALRTKSLCRKPDAIYRSCVRHWNDAVQTVAGWPQVLAPLDAHPRFYSLPWEDFPKSFQSQVANFLDTSGNPDVFAADYHRPVSPKTVALRRQQIREMASMLVASGFPIEKLTSLAVLVQIANATAALRQQRTRNLGSVTASMGQKAWLLVTIAEHWVNPTSNAVELRQLAQRLSVKTKGMVPRNRARLRQFDLKGNVDSWLHLSERVLKEAQADELGSVEQARRVMFALAVEIEIVAPMRVANLTALEVDRHIVQIGHGKDRNRHIVIPAHETKTDVPFEMMLPPQSVLLLDAYLTTFRGRLCTVPSAFLFPNPSGDKRSIIGFSRAISKFVQDETGITLHVHLARQVAAKLHLDAHPEDIETVRRILNHRSSATTLRAYAEQRTDHAFQNYDATIASLRERAGHISRIDPSRPPKSRNPKSPLPQDPRL